MKKFAIFMVMIGALLFAASYFSKYEQSAAAQTAPSAAIAPVEGAL